MRDEINKRIDENTDFFESLRHHFHKYPELSSQELETSKYIRFFLDSWNIPYETTGVSNIVATIKGGLTEASKEKVIALRGDIDALPIQEETGLEWKSVNTGVMHACGHDVHATFMLGTVKLLNEMKPKLKGTVKIIFQEGEEIGAGAKKLMESGLLDGIDTIVALHDTQELDLGIFALGYGTMSAYGAGGLITIETDGTVNAIIIAGQLISAVTALAAQFFSKEEQIVLVPTVVKTEENDGDIPSRVTVAYNSRTLNLENEIIMQKVLEEAVKNTASLFNCKIELGLRAPGNAVNNDKALTDLAASVIKKTFGKKSLLFTRPVMSGEDFALYQKSIPGTYIHLGGAVDGIYKALHTDKTCVDDKILPIGIEFLIRYVFAYFE